MSVCTVDYIPFNYQCYFQKILPAFARAFQGHPASLQTLLISATEIAHNMRTKYSVPLFGKERQAFLEREINLEGLLDVPMLRRVRSGEVWNPWEALAIVVPILEGRTCETMGKYGALLRSLLLATLCCELPPWSANWLSQEKRAVIWHDEVLFDWDEYTTRDEATRQLWGMFFQPLPQEIACLGENAGGLETPFLAEKCPRTLPFSLDESITGFIIDEEIDRLLQQVRTRARPELGSIVDGCIRDGESRKWTVEIEDLPPGVVKRQEECSLDDFYHRITGGKYLSHRDLFAYWKQTHPVEMEGFQQRYYQRLWMIEEEVLYRMRFAAARGWGILRAYS